MARNDGSDRICARNMNLNDTKILNVQKHNEREKESYVNQDIVPEKSHLNVHYKSPDGDYSEMFERMKNDKTISTRGLKADANKYGELIIDVNSAYFFNHGGYMFAKKFYEDAYKAAAKILGGEEYILSAVMHADERNKAMSEALGKDVFHYHLHIVYIPVVEKEILFSKRCKDENLRGTVKEKIMQVSSSKKWLSKPAVDENGNQILGKNGKPVLRKSYSVLQDDIFRLMRQSGYRDIERGERNSGEEHLTVTQFKIEKETEKLNSLTLEVDALEAKNAELLEDAEKATAEYEKAKSLQDAMLKTNEKIQDVSEKTFPDPETVFRKPNFKESASDYRKSMITVLKTYFVKAREIVEKYNQVRMAYERFAKRMDYLEARNSTLESENQKLSRENSELHQYKNDMLDLFEEFGMQKVKEKLAEIKQRRAEKENLKQIFKRRSDISR